MQRGEARGVTSLIGVILMVGVVVVVAATMTVFVFDIGSGLQSPAPNVDTEYKLVADGSEQTIAITLAAGDAVATDRLYVVGSKDVDMGGPPESSTPANDEFASPLEKSFDFTTLRPSTTSVMYRVASAASSAR